VTSPLVARASRSFARSPWSAPPPIRFLYVAPQVLLAAAFSDSLAILALRFTRVVATNSPEDFHLQVDCHAGHTKEKKGATLVAPFCISRKILRDYGFLAVVSFAALSIFMAAVSFAAESTAGAGAMAGGAAAVSTGVSSFVLHAARARTAATRARRFIYILLRGGGSAVAMVRARGTRIGGRI